MKVQLILTIFFRYILIDAQKSEVLKLGKCIVAYVDTLELNGLGFEEKEKFVLAHSKEAFQSNKLENDLVAFFKGAERSI